MKNFSLLIMLFISICMFSQMGNTVKVLPNGDYQEIPIDSITGKKFIDKNGEIHPIFKTSNGKLYITTTSKSGKLYRKYLKVAEKK